MKRLKQETQKFPKRYIVVCPKCNVLANLQYAPVKRRYIYCCPVCRAKVAAHISDLAPMGFPANKKTRKLRYEAHIMLTQIAELQGMSKSQSYEWLAKKLGKQLSDTHIGSFTVDELKKSIKIMDRCINKIKSAQRL